MALGGAGRTTVPKLICSGPAPRPTSAEKRAVLGLNPEGAWEPRPSRSRAKLSPLLAREAPSKGGHAGTKSLPKAQRKASFPLRVPRRQGPGEVRPEVQPPKPGPVFCLGPVPVGFARRSWLAGWRRALLPADSGREGLQRHQRRRSPAQGRLRSAQRMSPAVALRRGPSGRPNGRLCRLLINRRLIECNNGSMPPVGGRGASSARRRRK